MVRALPVLLLILVKIGKITAWAGFEPTVVEVQVFSSANELSKLYICMMKNY